MNKITRILLVVILIAALIFVRGFIAPYFYDPLREFFKIDYLQNPIPSVEMGNYFFHLFLRYLLNTVLSLVIIKLIFKDKSILIFAIKFYVIAFVFLSVQLYFILKLKLDVSYMYVFYLRRFLIQPLFLFILLPAIYYQKITLKKLK